jgi:hypothetical protein
MQFVPLSVTAELRKPDQQGLQKMCLQQVASLLLHHLWWALWHALAAEAKAIFCLSFIQADVALEGRSRRCRGAHVRNLQHERRHRPMIANQAMLRVRTPASALTCAASLMYLSYSFSLFHLHSNHVDVTIVSAEHVARQPHNNTSCPTPRATQSSLEVNEQQVSHI